ncbi:Integrase [Yoonia rosea]|uniref:Integrase n=1 Tax=Yoonia rosea TaxID=287098 RepID=A0A1R3WVC8_9RHOB|nr:site-specific integrase [Yoonia rosea]SIT82441.1 Integrase [Yoonia rosea]
MANRNKTPAKARLSAKFINSLVAGDRDYWIAEETFPKLKLKVTPLGNRSFVLRYRNAQGTERKLKLGDFPDINADQARQLASRYAAEVASGGDPAAQKQETRHGLTLSDLGQRFLEEHGELHLKATTLQNYRQILKAVIDPSLGKQPIVSISRAQLLTLQKSMANRRYQANRTIGFIRTLYNWAKKNGLYQGTDNPAQGIPPYRERKVESLLSKEQTAELWEAIKQIRRTHPGRETALNVITFCWLTACRRGEAFKLRWENVDFERSEVHFVEAKAGSRKQKMSTQLKAFLSQLSSHGSDAYVFPGIKRDTPLTDIKKTWDLVRQTAGLPNFRLHDIRHNVLSDIAAEYDLATAAAVGGHQSIRSTMRYAQARQQTTADALERLGSNIARYTEEDS